MMAMISLSYLSLSLSGLAGTIPDKRDALLPLLVSFLFFEPQTMALRKLSFFFKKLIYALSIFEFLKF
jgi:hypothetical protein